MTSKRVPLALILCTVLFVTSGFAATKKFDRHRHASQDWNDSPQMSVGLLSEGSGVPGGGASLSMGSLESSPLVSCPGTDCWNGGTGNWHDRTFWSTGSAPGSSDDVYIDSSHETMPPNQQNDLVTLDVSTTINSLVLGGAPNGFTSKLTDFFGPHAADAQHYQWLDHRSEWHLGP